MTTTGLLALAKAALPTLLALMATVGGFALLKLSAAVESYILLSVAFAVMIAGVLTLFGVRRPIWR